MSSIRQQQDADKIQQRITDSIVDNMVNPAGGDDDDSSATQKAGHGGKAHGKAGSKHLHVGAAAKDGVDLTPNTHATAGGAALDKSSVGHEPPTNAPTTHHFNEVDDFADNHAAAAASVPGSPTAASQAAKTQLSHDLSASPADTAKITKDTTTYINALKAEGHSAAAISQAVDSLGEAAGVSTDAQAALQAGAVTALAGDDTSAVGQAKAQLGLDLAANPPDTAKIKADTQTYVAAQKAAGTSAADIQSDITSMAQAPGVSNAAAEAFVEAAKEGINTDDSNDDKAAQAKAQKSVDVARDQNAERQAQAAAAAQSQPSSDDSGDSSDGGSSTGGTGDSDSTGGADSSDDTGSSTSADTAGDGSVNDTSGDGDYGNANIASNSKEYKGMSIEQLLASKGPVGDAMRARPDLVADIKAASAATGVPAGLLAGLTYAESSFGSDASTTYDHDGDATGGVTQEQQSIVSHFVPGGSVDNAADNIMACAKGLKTFYDASQSWGAALRGWNTYDPTDSGNVAEVGKLTDLTNVSEGGISSYVTNILNYITAKGEDPPG